MNFGKSVIMLPSSPVSDYNSYGTLYSVVGGGGGSSFVQSGATVIVQQVATSGRCDANNDGCITISY